MIGNGLRTVFTSQFRVTGNEDIPNVFTIFNLTNFPGLVITPVFNEIFTLDPNGEFIFNLRGILHGYFSLNLEASVGPTDIEISPEFYDSETETWSFLDARMVELAVLGQTQTIIVGQEIAKKGDRLRFSFRSPDGTADFKTNILGNGSQVPAGLFDFNLHVR
jgi:hypothetical protein